MVPDPTGQSRSSIPEPATGLLYQGTAGVAWFLGHLAQVSDDRDLRRCAEGGVRHALDFAGQLHNASFGLHSGRVGIAWVAAQLAGPLDQPQWLDEAWQVLEPLVGHESQDHSLDVIGGAAGAIPALLEMRSLLDRDELLIMARGLGEHLLSKVHMEPVGWSWATLPQASFRNLNGFAHGASGIGLALMELAVATGDGRYRFASEMASLYERSFYDPQQQNWPDLRNQALSEIYQFGKIDYLRNLIRHDRVPRYHLNYMTAWCHGSPGIGLARLRAWELTGQKTYLEEANHAMHSTAVSLTPEALRRSNYSLCHGGLGNCELLLHGAEILQDKSLRSRCEEVASFGTKEWEEAEKPWPSGTLDSQSDGSLLLGEAGIGSVFLRLAEASVPSPLLLRPDHGSQTTLPTDGYAELAEASQDAFFAASRKRWHGLTQGAFVLPPIEPGETPLQVSPSESARQVFEDFLSTQDDQRPLLEDAWAVERSAYVAQAEIRDFTAESLRNLVRPSWQELSLKDSLFSCAPDARLVTTQHAWPGIEPSEAASDSLPAEEEITVLLLRLNQRFVQHPLGRFAAAVLEQLETPQSLEDLVRAIAEAVGADDPAAVAPTVMQQMEQLYDATFVDAVNVNAAKVKDEVVGSAVVDATPSPQRNGAQ